MTLSRIINIILLVVGFGLGALIATKCTQEKRGVSSGVESIRFFPPDTIFIPQIIKVDTVIYKPQPFTVYKDRIVKQVQPNGDSTLLVRNYKSKVELEKDLSVTYDADVTGTLDQIRLGIVDTRPQKIVERRIELSTIERVDVPTTGLYVGGFASPSFNSYGPQIDLVTPKLKFGVNYNLRSTETQPLFKTEISVGYKLFGNK